MLTAVVRVPLNTMLADLDEALRTLLKRELERHGFDGVDIAFDTPDKEWSATLSAPTVNLFLYDLRESKEHRAIDWEPRQQDDGLRELRPPLLLESSYLVSAWTREVRDEHRLLSQVLAILYAFPELPADILNGALTNGSRRQERYRTRVARPRGEGTPDVWSTLGARHKASIDFSVTMACDAGTYVERGPEVAGATVRMLDGEGGRGKVEETHRAGGRVRDAAGDPVADAWVVAEEAGAWASTDAEGRFVLKRLRAGTYRVSARVADGRSAEGELTVPGGTLELELPAGG